MIVDSTAVRSSMHGTRTHCNKIEGVHSDGIRSVCFSPDGKTLCLGSHDKTASLIDVETGAMVRKIEGVHSDRIVLQHDTAMSS
eukprot:SAG22_NODE_1876_length_3387_cov_3.762470_3_plen_84_part_00